MKRGIVITENYTNLTTESLRYYLREVSKIKVFETAEEEYECAVKAVNGDEKALDELVTRNLRFVISVAKKYQNENAPLLDLIDQGNIGLIEAAKKYDPSMGNKFISYAVWWIRKEIMDYLNNDTRMVRLPLNKVTMMNKFNRAVDKIKQSEGRDVSKEELYEVLEGFDKDDIDDIFRINESVTTSYDKTLTDESGSISLIDTIESESRESQTDHLMHDSDNKDVFNNLFTKLNPTQEKVIKLFFGIGTNRPMNLSEVGTELGISRERVRQIKERSLRILRVNGKNLGLNELPF